MAAPDSPGDDEDFLIEDEVEGTAEGGASAPEPLPPWPLLVVDDEPGVHDITRLALARLEFKKRRLEILHAYSGAEALEILRRRHDIAVILLDVVMETDDAGLTCVRAIREEIGNREVRIILRTGQPGQAPEQRVILDYDINDYKAKTELTAQRLFTTMIAALRTYDHITTIETSRRGLNMVIDASASLFRARSLEQLHSGVLIQLQAITGVGEDGILCLQREPARSAAAEPDRIIVLAACGRYAGALSRPLDQAVPPEAARQIEACFETRQSIFGERLTTLFIATPAGREVVASFDSPRPVTPQDRATIALFAEKVSLGFDNLYRVDQLRAGTQAAMALIAAMADRQEAGAGRLALRTGQLAERLARRLAADTRTGPAALDGTLDSTALDLMALATTMALCGPPEGLPPMPTPGVFELVTRLGSGLEERWDGSGPAGLRGREIPLAARIVAAARRFEMLCAGTGTAQAMPPAAAAAQLRQEAGRAFDPAVVDALVAECTSPAADSP